MTAIMMASRFGVEDFETASIRSAAPSYVSEVPSYHSTITQGHTEAIPAYTPRTTPSASAPGVARTQPMPRRQTIGLPPVPAARPAAVPSLHNFRVPSWSANNALASRHYHNVAQRRVVDGRYADKRNTTDRTAEHIDEVRDELRPLEDPYLVGEEAAAQARRERLARENGDDILIREDRRWDFLLVQMKDWDERERSWNKFRREVNHGRGKRLLNRLGRLA